MSPTGGSGINGAKVAFSHPDYDCCRLLNNDDDASSPLAFVAVAGAAGTNLSQPPGVKQQMSISVNTNGTNFVAEPRFVIIGAADQDGDGKLHYLVTTFLQPGNVHEENVGE